MWRGPIGRVLIGMMMCWRVLIAEAMPGATIGPWTAYEGVEYAVLTIPATLFAPARRYWLIISPHHAWFGHEGRVFAAARLAEWLRRQDWPATVIDAATDVQLREALAASKDEAKALYGEDVGEDGELFADAEAAAEGQRGWRCGESGLLWFSRILDSVHRLIALRCMLLLPFIGDRNIF